MALLSCSPVVRGKKETSEEALRRRVSEYWGYRVSGELDKCYGYEYPLLRKQKTLIQYLKKYKTRTLKWLDFGIKGVRIEEDAKADVMLDLKVAVRLPGIPPHQRDSAIVDRWVKIDGIWYHVFE